MFATRLAPTPSGYLHIGNAWSFFCTYKIAEIYGAKIFLRIDDFDGERVRPEYLDDIFESLCWLNLGPWQGPQSLEDFLKLSHSNLVLKRAKEKLEALKNLSRPGQIPVVYPCSCTRKTIENWYLSRGLEKKGYPGICRTKTGLAGNQWPWRFNVSTMEGVSLPTLNSRVFNYRFHAHEDFILCNKYQVPSYQLQSLIYDHWLKVNLLVRGKDLISSSAYQMALIEKLGMQTDAPWNFFHHPLIVDETGRKLSKSRGAISLLHWRKSGLRSQLLVEKFEELFRNIYPRGVENGPWPNRIPSIGLEDFKKII